jgi:hypothetical protein
MSWLFDRSNRCCEETTLQFVLSGMNPALNLLRAFVEVKEQI